MDVLLSIPLISAVLTPSLSTSVNILFFYATWSALVLSHKPEAIHATSLLVLRVIFWLAPSLLFLAFDFGIPSVAGSIKFDGAKRLPRRPLKLIGLATFNMLLVVAVEAGVSWLYTLATGNTLYKVSTTLPLPWQMFKQTAILFTAREVLTYYIHRYLLHEGAVMPLLTRLHTSYSHGEPVCALQLYADHPLPLVIYHLVPVLLPAFVLHPHLLTYLAFTLLTTIEGTLVTSGYSIVPGIFLGGIARRTARHYASRGTANYGAWGILDWAHGTSKGKDFMDDARDEADKHNLKERSSAKLDDGAGMVQDGVDTLRRSTRKRTPKKN